MNNNNRNNKARNNNRNQNNKKNNELNIDNVNVEFAEENNVQDLVDDCNNDQNNN